MIQLLWTMIATFSILVACLVAKAPLIIIITSLVGVLFVVGVAYKNKQTNLLGIILYSLLAYMSWEAGYYINMVINLLIIPLQILAHLLWKNDVKTTPLTVLTLRQISKWILVFFIPILAVAAYLFGSELWIHDAISGALLLAATTLLVVRDSYQWKYWIPYNALEVFMWFTAASLAPEVLAIAVMRVVFLLNSIIGYFSWRTPNGTGTLLPTKTSRA